MQPALRAALLTVTLAGSILVGALAAGTSWHDRLAVVAGGYYGDGYGGELDPHGPDL